MEWTKYCAIADALPKNEVASLCPNCYRAGDIYASEDYRHFFAKCDCGFQTKIVERIGRMRYKTAVVNAARMWEHEVHKWRWDTFKRQQSLWTFPHSVTEIAKMGGVDRSTVYCWIRKGRLVPSFIGEYSNNKGKDHWYRITMDDIRRFVRYNPQYFNNFFTKEEAN